MIRLLLLCLSPLLLFAESLSSSFCQAIERTHAPLSEKMIQVSVAKQRLFLFKEGVLLRSFAISTAKAGVGQRLGSEQTPLGLHRIHQKIGQNAPLLTIFQYRKNSGMLCTTPCDEDLILTRILTLEGLEIGVNRGKDSSGFVVDSLQRCIYIHGTNHEDKIGSPASKGCIRMRSKEITELFQLVDEGTLLWIE